MYTTKDISVIIPTYNRELDLKETLKSILQETRLIREIIIIDQSSSHHAFNLIKNLKKKFKNLRYFHSRIPSLTKARNLGIRKLKSSKIVLFLDDDVTLEEDYFLKILDVFNEYPQAKGAAAYVPSPELSNMSFLEKALRMLFFISYPEKNKARIISVYGNTYPSSLKRIINSGWLPGVNMAYKKEIFKEQSFDENLKGYTVAEDIDFTYRLSKKYPKSLFITPFASLLHRASKKERSAIREISYINQVDHFYFYTKNMSASMIMRIKYFWSLLGISFLRFLLALKTRKRTDILKLKYFLSSILYCYKERKKIRQGRLREWMLNN